MLEPWIDTVTKIWHGDVWPAMSCKSNKYSGLRLVISPWLTLNASKEKKKETGMDDTGQCESRTAELDVWVWERLLRSVAMAWPSLQWFLLHATLSYHVYWPFVHQWRFCLELSLLFSRLDLVVRRGLGLTFYTFKVHSWYWVIAVEWRSMLQFPKWNPIPLMLLWPSTWSSTLGADFDSQWLWRWILMMKYQNKWAFEI